MTAVDEQIARRKAGREEGSPPPVIILRTQMEIAQQDRRFRARDHENQKDQEQEAKHVVSMLR